MRNISDKQDNTAGAVGQLPAEEYNDHKNEIQKAVEKTGQTLNAAITDQFPKALFINSTGAESMQDAGTGANTIQLSPVTGVDGLVVPDSYSHLNGCVVTFNKVNANDSTSVVVNIGQTGVELGAKSLVRPDGTAVQPGEVIGDCMVKYNLATDQWFLMQSGAYKKSVNSIAELRTYPGKYQGQTIDVLGYYTAGDVSDMPRPYWDTSSTLTDNDGSVIAVSGVATGRWLWGNVGLVDQKWFGVKGDGTDDRAAIIKAIADYNTKLRDGDYAVSAAITPENNNVHMDDDAYIIDPDTNQSFKPLTKRRVDFTRSYDEWSKRFSRINAPTIVCYGDSNTRYYEGDNGAAGSLSYAFSSFLEIETASIPILYGSEVINAGNPGWTISQGLSAYSTNITGNNANIATIGFGTNDIKLSGSNLDTYLTSMETFINQLLDDGVFPIILGIPWFEESYGATPTEQKKLPIWNSRLKDLCEKYQVPFIDVYKMFTDNPSVWFNEVTTPKRHYSTKATRVLGSEIANIIKKYNTISAPDREAQYQVDQFSYLNLDFIVNGKEDIEVVNYQIAEIGGISTVKIPDGKNIDVVVHGKYCLGFYPRDASTVTLSGDVSEVIGITDTLYDGIFFPIKKVFSSSYSLTAESSSINIAVSGGDAYLRIFSSENAINPANDVNYLRVARHTLPRDTSANIAALTGMLEAQQYWATDMFKVVTHFSGDWYDSSGYFTIGTTAQRTSVGSLVAKGFKFYDTDLSQLYRWDGTTWNAI